MKLLFPARPAHITTTLIPPPCALAAQAHGDHDNGDVLRCIPPRHGRRRHPCHNITRVKLCCIISEMAIISIVLCPSLTSTWRHWVFTMPMAKTCSRPPCPCPCPCPNHSKGGRSRCTHWHHRANLMVAVSPSALMDKFKPMATHLAPDAELAEGRS